MKKKVSVLKKKNLRVEVIDPKALPLKNIVEKELKFKIF